jgi:hypothetical protein
MKGDSDGSPRALLEIRRILLTRNALFRRDAKGIPCSLSSKWAYVGRNIALLLVVIKKMNWPEWPNFLKEGIGVGMHRRRHALYSGTKCTCTCTRCSHGTCTCTQRACTDNQSVFRCGPFLYSYWFSAPCLKKYKKNINNNLLNETIN